MKYVIILERVGENEEPVYYAGYKTTSRDLVLAWMFDEKHTAQNVIDTELAPGKYPNAVIEQIPVPISIDMGTKERAHLKSFEARGTDSARKIEVIETTALKGNGEHGNPIRLLTQYWSLDGKLLATVES